MCSECLVYWTLVIYRDLLLPLPTHPLVYTRPSVLFNKTVHGVPFNGTEQKRLYYWYITPGTNLAVNHLCYQCEFIWLGDSV